MEKKADIELKYQTYQTEPIVQLVFEYNSDLIRQLKAQQVDSKRHLLIILNAKGNKDRVVPISDKVILLLREYYKFYKPAKWLFEGRTPGEQYSESSLQEVLKGALRKAKSVNL